MRFDQISATVAISFACYLAVGQEPDGIAPRYSPEPNIQSNGPLAGQELKRNFGKEIEPPPIPRARTIEPQTKIEELSEPLLPRRDWKLAGLATPQQTLETFMWSLREQNDEWFGACLSASEEREVAPTLKDFARLNDAVYGIQSLAIKTSGSPSVVDLKFRWAILGEGKTVLSHRFKLQGDTWKLDLSANTYEADW